MTTGGALYLISACGSAEEFVAAFRRYADRTGLFVPIASPLPQGRHGRIALTLKDGGVMIEGEAEIVQSSAKSPLHGRAGMVIKFTEPDEPSKVVLAELEKARLAMKPSPPSVPPRPAEVPAEPRPVPPAIGGRIDAANALAECVVIGDASALKEIESAGPPKAGQKFVVPSIPAMGGRPKTPTAQPEPKPADAVKPEPKLTTVGMPAVKPPAIEAKKDPTPIPAKAAESNSGPTPIAAESKSGATPVAPKPAEPKSGATAVPATTSETKSGPTPPVAKSAKLTQIGFPVVKLPAEMATPKPEPKATTLGMSPLKITETQPVGLVPAPPKVADVAVVTNKPLREDATEPLPMKGDKPPLPAPIPTRSKSGTTPPRHPTPFAPLPVTRMPAKPAPVLDLVEEPTDLTSVPLEQSVVAAEAPTVESGKVAPPIVPEDKPAETARPARSGGMRASEILAAVQVDDWTMTPDASAPTVLPASPKLPENPKPAVRHDPEVPEPTPAPGGPPTGDWTMSLDPEEGWSKPEKLAPPPPATPVLEKPTAVTKIDKRIPTAAQTPSTGNPVHAIASEKPIEAVQWEDKPTSVGEKIEIDPTLMEPLQPLPADEELSATNQVSMPPSYPPAGSAPGMARSASASMPQVPMAADPPMRAANVPPPLSAGVFPPPSGSMPAVPNATGQQASYSQQDMPIGFAPTLLPGQMQAPPPAFGYPSPPPSYQPYQSESVAAVPMRSNKRLIVIVASAATAVILAIVLAVTMSGHKKKHAPEARGSAGSAVQQQVAPPLLPIDAAVAAVTMPDAAAVAVGSGSATQQVAVGSDAKADTCNVEVTTNPPGAEVSLDDKTVLGTTPGTYALPCGAATKLYLKKAKYLTVIRAVTPAPDGTKVAATLGVGQFSVKITSMPAGATITVGGKSKGVTPAAVQLPAFTTQAITLTKDGFQPDTQKVVIKTNGLSHHVVLKKGGKHH